MFEIVCLIVVGIFFLLTLRSYKISVDITEYGIVFVRKNHTRSDLIKYALAWFMVVLVLFAPEILNYFNCSEILIQEINYLKWFFMGIGSIWAYLEVSAVSDRVSAAVNSLKRMLDDGVSLNRAVDIVNNDFFARGYSRLKVADNNNQKAVL